MTVHEAKNIIGRADSRHEKYYQNDPATVREVNAAFERQHPGEVDLADDPALTDAMAKALNLQTPGGTDWSTKIHRGIF
jgi:hypothetical protein